MKTTKRMPTSLKYTEIVRLAVAEFLEKQKQAGKDARLK